MHVIVLGRNYSSVLGMVRAAGIAGCEVSVIKIVKKKPSNFAKTLMLSNPVDSKSKYIKRYTYSIESDQKSLIELLLTDFCESGIKPILLPTDDFTASTIDLYQDILSEYFLYPNIDNKVGKVVYLMNKKNQKNIVQECELDIAESWVINIEKGEYRIPKGIKYPCFTKPQISFLGNKRCMKKCRSEKELIDVIEEVASTTGCPILVEEYLEIEKEYAVLGCSGLGCTFIPYIIEMQKSGSGPHRGVTMKGSIKPLKQDGDLAKKLTQFMESIHFTGLFDIDLYENDGRLYFNELNLRFGASGYAVTALGINLPQLFIDYITCNEQHAKTLLGQYREVLRKKTNTCVFVNEKVAEEDFAGGYLTLNQYRRMVGEADIRFIYSFDDIEPYRLFKLKEYITIAKRSIKNTLKIGSSLTNVGNRIN